VEETVEGVTVRDQQSRDLETVVDLAVISLEWHSKTFKDVSLATGRHDLLDGFRQFAERSGSYFRVAEIDGAVVGFLTAQLTPASNQSAGARSPTVWIADVAVSLEARRCGVGRALIRDLEEWAVQEGADEVKLRMHAGNEPARQLYESAGFQSTWVTYGKHLGKPHRCPGAVMELSNVPTGDHGSRSGGS
jgi:GNAT superfamily N-acetyltransferase